MREFLFSKDVDKSLLVDGLTVPVAVQDQLQQLIGRNLHI